MTDNSKRPEGKRIIIKSGPHGTPVNDILDAIGQVGHEHLEQERHAQAEALPTSGDYNHGGKTDGYFLFATRNPLEEPVGAPLSEAMMDRFVHPLLRFGAENRSVAEPNAHDGRDLDTVTTLPTDVVLNAIAEDNMDQLNLAPRCFTTIAGSFKGVNERIVGEIDLLEKRDFNVSAYRDAYMRVLEASQPFAGLMVRGGQVAVDADIRAAVDNAFSLQHQLDMNVRHANFYLDSLAEANRNFTAHSGTAPRTLCIADEKSDSTILPGFVAFAADSTELKQSSLAALGTVKGHLEKIDMRAADKALNEGRRFATRAHMCEILVKRGTLIDASNS
jgi:hypothetical protein